MFSKNIDKDPGIIIAEIACGHNGSFSNFIKIINKVSETKCKIIKSQIFKTIERSNPDHSEWDIFKKLTLSQKEWIKIVSYAKKKGLFFFSDVFGSDGLKIARKCKVDGYKIHSESIVDVNLIENVLKDKKPTLLGIGGSHRNEIYNLLTYLKSKNLCNNLVLMPGIQNFPTKLNSHSLYEIKDLANKYNKKFNIKIGCADHISGNLTESIDYPLLAMSAGAELIEKHFTIDRKLKWEDYESALDFNKFKKFVKKVNTYKNLLIPINFFSEDEKIYRNMFKKIPIFKKNLKAGSILKSNDFIFIKSDKNKETLSSTSIVNQVLKKNVTKNEVIKFNCFRQKVGAIIVVRNSSTRLKNKALKKINGKSTIALLIERIKRCKNLDKIILATTRDKKDDVFESICKDLNINIFRGDKNNVSQRFYEAAKRFKIQHIVRITGDDILRDQIMIDKAIENHLKKNSDVTITTNMPYGTQTEIFTIDTIKIILDNVHVPSNTEYLEWYLQNTRNFTVNFVKSDYNFNNRLRLTLDYLEDLNLFKKIFSYFEHKKNFNLADVIKLINKNPNLLKINSKKSTKIKTFKNKDNLITSNDINLDLEI